MLNVIIFSKDRACQLDALMRSIADNVVGWDTFKWSVIFKSSNDNFQRGYDKVRSSVLGRYYRMVKEDGRKSFQQYVREHLSQTIAHTMFLVDDDVFINRWDHNDGILRNFADSKVLTASLRMDARYDYCYTQKKPMKIPNLDVSLDGTMRWEWQGQQGDWGYPMSLDGHIFRSVDVNSWLANINFNNPNTLEGGLSRLPAPEKKIMVGYREARIINIPANKVQTFNSNHSGLQHGFTAQQLNDIYLQGKTIDLTSVYLLSGINAPHFEVDLKFK